jgi:hypothetical protein
MTYEGMPRPPRALMSAAKVSSAARRWLSFVLTKTAAMVLFPGVMIPASGAFQVETNTVDSVQALSNKTAAPKLKACESRGIFDFSSLWVSHATPSP